jgi:hypothetical protein
MLKEVAGDLREFVKQHRSVIYTVALVALVDHFCFNGALRGRIKTLLENMLSKAEAKINNGASGNG